jgi:hypothetical protein
MTLQVLEVLAGAIAGIGAIVGVFWFTFARAPERKRDASPENEYFLSSPTDDSHHSADQSGFWRPNVHSGHVPATLYHEVSSGRHCERQRSNPD